MSTKAHKTLDRTLMALADPTRRAILHRLAREGEARVTDLAKPFRMSLNSVSKHIRVLEEAAGAPAAAGAGAYFVVQPQAAGRGGGVDRGASGVLE